MVKLVYTPIASFDGYTSDQVGSFEWGAPDPEVHAFINDLEPTSPPTSTDPGCTRRCSSARCSVPPRNSPPRAGLRSDMAGGRQGGVFDDARSGVQCQDPDRAGIRSEPVLRMKQTAAHDLSVGGPDLGGQATAAGLVDEVHLLLTLVTLGGGTRAIRGHLRSNLELLAWTAS